ncbi:MAG: response regulator transcription factor [Actinomycetota bacterium]|nr:response regulator transcription factor [Actinomycetota bacterium]
MRAFLEMTADIRIVGEAADGHEALVGIEELMATGEPPDVVMMDLVMPDMDGIAATEAIKKRWPTIDVVVMTSFSEAARVQAALTAGASGYVLKDAEADEVAQAIRAANRGEVHLDASVTREVAQALRSGPRSVSALTQRERDILQLVGRGMSNQEIAAALFISERTARTHVSNILLKLQLSSRTQAALWAIREGITPSP